MKMNDIFVCMNYRNRTMESFSIFISKESIDCKGVIEVKTLKANAFPMIN